MTGSTQKTPEQILCDVDQYVRDAVGDMASDMLSPHSGFLDDAWSKRIKKAKKSGCRDLLGWLADELYNDPEALCDLMGDKIYEACNGDRTAMATVYDVMEQRGGRLAKAAKLLRK